MVSTLIIAIATVLSLFLVRKILRSGVSEICSLDDWECKKPEVDPVALRILLEPSEKNSSANRFRRFSSGDSKEHVADWRYVSWNWWEATLHADQARASRPGGGESGAG